MSDYDDLGISWEPGFGPYEPEPEPCQYCTVMSGVLKECDQTCDTLTKEAWIELTKEQP
jgi:hypothetical protein